MKAPRNPWRMLVRLVLVAAVLAVVGELAWQRYREPVRAAVRDYLALRRVETHRESLLTAAHESGIDPCLLAGLMVAESGGRVGARSRVDALGLFQLTMVSARWRAQVLGLPEPDEQALLTDATLNARLGANNLAWLLDTYDGNVERALCAYNTGARRLKQLTDEAGGWEAWWADRRAAGDSLLHAYVRRVLSMRDEVHSSGIFADVEEPPPAAPEPPPSSGPPGTQR
jgi:soluble lytic murein transglycosylase-like protein